MPTVDWAAAHGRTRGASCRPAAVCFRARGTAAPRPPPLFCRLRREGGQAGWGARLGARAREGGAAVRPPPTRADKETSPAAVSQRAGNFFRQLFLSEWYYRNRWSMTAPSVDLSEAMVRLSKYLLEEVPWVCRLLILAAGRKPKPRGPAHSVVAATFSVIDLFAPSISPHARQGAGSGIGASLTSGPSERLFLVE